MIARVDACLSAQASQKEFNSGGCARRLLFTATPLVAGVQLPPPLSVQLLTILALRVS